MNVGIFDWVEASERLAPGEVYAHRLQMAEAADKAGFHAYMLAEHQGTPLSIDASPGLLLAAMSQRTRRLRLRAHLLPALVRPLPLLQRGVHARPPLGRAARARGRARRVADRGADLRHAGHGDLARPLPQDAGFLLPGLRQPGGQVPRRRRRAPHKPVQKPYPPLWFPSSSKDSIEFTGRHGYHTAIIGSHAEARARFAQYREVWEKHKGDPGRHNAHVARPFLARTQHLVISQNEKEAIDFGVSAYETWKGHLHHLARKHARPDVIPLDPFAEGSVMRLIAGTSQQVTEKLKDVIRQSGMNYLLCVFSFGSLPPAMAMRSLELFAREVMPGIMGTEEA